MRTIRIGNGQGFWGDNVDAPVELLRGGPIDYIGMDYLAEVTLSIMMRQKLKDPRLGYATDFIGFVRRVLPEIKERNVRILANAGGLNPRACREKIFEVARELGVSGLRVGVVEGDDIFPRLRELIAAGHAMKQHGHRRAAGAHARPGDERQRLPRRAAGRRGARARARTSCSAAGSPTRRWRWRR